MAEMKTQRPEWKSRRTGNLPVHDRTILKLSMRNIYGNGADCVAWAVFGRRLSPGEIPVLVQKLKLYKQELLHGINIDTSGWDELQAIETAVSEFAAAYSIPYNLTTDLVENEIEF